MAKRVAQFVLLEAFAEVAGEGCLQNFGKAQVGDIPERDLSAIIETASDNTSVMENCNVCVERSASACNSFVFRLSSLV